MKVEDLAIPAALVSLIETGRWPQNPGEASRQNLHPRFPAEFVRRIAPEEDQIYLYPPPFAKPRRMVHGWLDFHGTPDLGSPPGNIDPERSVMIGDFGMGSDAGIALDYRQNPDCPEVIRYRWATDVKNKMEASKSNRWVYLAASFLEFATMLGL